MSKKLLKSRPASEKLQISERTLWSSTEPRGDIPAVRIGNCVRYSEDALDRYIERKTKEASNA